jgi:carboxyl-terminal processing protease
MLMDSLRMEFVLRVFLRSIALPAAAVLVTSFSISVDNVSAQAVDSVSAQAVDSVSAQAVDSGSAQAVDETVSTLPDGASAALDIGLELERTQLWSDSVRHYEDATSNFPNSTALYQRLVISRLHYDVNRRYQDNSYMQAIRELNTSQALDLYSEILANLQTHYVENVDWSRVMLHGTAALEIALTEEKFVSQLLPEADPEAIERFQQTIHHHLQNRSTSTRFDLRANIAYVAEIARDEIGLDGTATVLEYLSGAVSTLDPYTRLLSPSQLDEMFSNIEGNFVGLGIELKAEPEYLQILSVIKNGPAEEAGVRAGERIVRVETASTDEVDTDYVADLLRGVEHTYVSLSIMGVDGENRDLRIQRRRVEVPCVENVHFVDVDNRIGYLRLTNFQKTTTRDVERALWDLHRQRMRALIIDVRGNPGGLLSAAVEVADRFLGNGRIVTTRGRNARENFDYMAHRANTWNVPLAVLVDHDSASASEIFAGAIADSGRGVIVGETSYGKGSIQGIFRMQTARFGLCLTTAKFFSPNGRAISRNGIIPTIEVEPTYIAARPDPEGRMTLDSDDAVMQKAIEQFVSRNKVSRRP